MTKKTKKLHIKPTNEELDANAQKALEEAKALKNKSKEPKKEDSKPSKKPKPQKPKPKPDPIKSPEPDYKKKFIASTKEGQILYAKNKKMSESLGNAMNVPEPTEKEMQKEYADWEIMSEFEKKIAKESLRGTQRFAALEEITKENKKLDQWQKSVDSYIDDPQILIDNPKLEGKTDEFKLFATKPTRRNMDFSDIVKAFLYDVTETSVNKQKGDMFPDGTGGSTTKDKPRSGKMSFEEGQQLKNSNFKEYSKLLKTGKIEDPDL